MAILHIDITVSRHACLRMQQIHTAYHCRQEALRKSLSGGTLHQQLMPAVHAQRLKL
jgi:hypothetical protein